MNFYPRNISEKKNHRVQTQLWPLGSMFLIRPMRHFDSLSYILRYLKFRVLELVARALMFSYHPKIYLLKLRTAVENHRSEHLLRPP